MKTKTSQKILNHDFILATFTQLTTAFVFYSLIPTLPIYLSRLGSDEIEIGILIGIFAIASLIPRPFVGRALLKIPEKNFMMAGSLLFAITSLAYLFTPPFWPFLIVRVFQGIGFALFQTAVFALIANISSEANRGQSFSHFWLAGNISGALAPSIAIFLINHFSFTLLFLACSGLSLCSLVMAYKLERRHVAPLQGSSIEEGSFISRIALPPSIISSFSLFTWGAINAFFPLYAIRHGVTNPGLFFTTSAVMLILGRALCGKIIDLYSKEKIIMLSITPFIISMVILAFSKTLPMFLLVAVIYGIGQAFIIPTLTVYILDRGGAPGPAMGTLTAISDLGISLGPVVMGIVLRMTSYPIMFLCLAFMGIINFNYFNFFVRKKG
jgi:MFS family permease